MIDKPKVSVSIITYNHEKYIAQAIESVLSQKTDFPFEIIIGEDGSTDNTPKICQEYQAKYPDIIKVFLNDRSTVIYVDGAPTGKWNLNNNIVHTRGEYVALLEGDDYWSDTTKLQRQIDQLDANKELSMSFHDIAIVNSAGEPMNIEKLPAAMKKDLSREELISGYHPTPPTGSIVYRREYLSVFPDWFYTFKNGDIVISIILSEFGKAGYLDRKMSDYRQHAGGVWSSTNIIHRAKLTVKMRKILIEKFAPIGVKNNCKLIVDNYLLILKKSFLSGKIGILLANDWKLCQFLWQQKAARKYFFKRILGQKNA